MRKIGENRVEITQISLIIWTVSSFFSKIDRPFLFFTKDAVQIR
ncbi:hypothetical protein BSM4216_3237 [Bacillus smithii]|nr:hypothetical protein BSM4216_3237 [Bacillus smithii]